MDIEDLRQRAKWNARLAWGAKRQPKMGMYEGLTESGRAQIHPRPGEQLKHHAGYLAGHLIAWTAANRPFDQETMLLATGYAAAIATPEGQRALASAPSPARPAALRAHVFAAALIEIKTRQRLDLALEQLFFEWLLEQSCTPSTDELFAKMNRLRERRLQRTGM